MGIIFGRDEPIYRATLEGNDLIFDDLKFNFSRGNREHIIEILNEIMRFYRCTIDGINAEHIEKDLYRLRSVHVFGEEGNRIATISSSRYGDRTNVQLFDFWYANYSDR